MTRAQLETKYYDLLNYIIENKGSDKIYDILSDLDISESEYNDIGQMTYLRLISVVENMQIYIHSAISNSEVSYG